MKDKKILWYNLAFMAFSTVWGFANVANGFIYFNGTQAIFSWFFMFLLYFVPYALMVGELGSAFKHLGGGVSSWIQETKGTKLAYYAGWTYWACHITYIASKSSGGLKSLSWAIFRNAETYDQLPTLWIQLATLGIFLFFCYIATKGINPLKKLATLAGTSMFIMSILYIILMFTAPIINPNGGYNSIDFSWDAIIPQFDINYFTSLSILVFAVGGCEKISPYVNKVKDPAKGFPKGMILLAIMVMITAILGTVAMGMMFDPAIINQNDETFNAYVANGAYWAFQDLGKYYNLGDTFLIIYAICNTIGQFSTLVLSIDAPLRMLLDNEKTHDYIPKKLLKKNKHGAYINGILLVVILSGSLILIQSLVPGATAVLSQLNKLNAVCMPLRYLWVFFAYIALRKAIDKFPAEYRFTKNQFIAKFFGWWCFGITLTFCILGMYSKDMFTMCLNIITPFILVVLGMILPIIAKREQNKGE